MPSTGPSVALGIKLNERIIRCMARLVESNKHICSPELRMNVAARSVASSSMIEGIKVTKKSLVMILVGRLTPKSEKAS